MNAPWRARYGEWAVVTGASSGIGREISLLLAARGLNLVLTARRAAELENLRQQIIAKHPVEVQSIPLDLAAAGAAGQLLECVSDRWVGLLVNSAGFGSGGVFLATDPREEAAMVDLNCRAVVELCHGFAHRFVARKRGGIILLSSIVAYQGVPFAATYSATKAFVQSFGEALTEELAPHGVDVLLAAPGPVASGFGARARMNLDNAESASLVASEIVNALGRQRRVVPGFHGKFLTGSLSTAPRFLRVKIMKSVMKSMT
jgi:short-subunit dehydrogenase